MASSEDIRGSNALMSASMVNALRDGYDMAAAATADLMNLNREMPEDTLAVTLTATDGGTPPLYSWTLRQKDKTGARIDHENGRTGTPTKNPAYDPNGLVISLPVEAWIRRFGWVDAQGGAVYEVISGGGGDGGIWIELTREGLGPDGQQAYYAWTEMEEDGAGGFQAKSGGLSGTLTDEPARDSSFKSAAPLGMVVRAHKGTLGDTTTIWWFITPDLDQDIMCTSSVPEVGAPATQNCPAVGGTIPGNWASAYVDKYNPMQDVWHKKEVVWLKHINGMALVSGQRYRGHFCGYSPCENSDGTGNGFIPVYTTSDCCTPLGDGGPDDDTVFDDTNAIPVPSIGVPCCEVNIPITLTLTISAPLCPLIDGITMAMVYQLLQVDASCGSGPGPCEAFGWQSRLPTAGELADCPGLEPTCPWLRFTCCGGGTSWSGNFFGNGWSTFTVTSCSPFVGGMNSGTEGLSCCGVAGIQFNVTE